MWVQLKNIVGEDKAIFWCCEKSGGETTFTTIALPLTSPFQLQHHVTAMQHCTASLAPIYREEGGSGGERKKENESMNYDRLLSVSFDTPLPPPTQTRMCERMRERRQWRGRLIVLSLPCSPRSHAQNLSGCRLSRRAAPRSGSRFLSSSVDTRTITDKTSFISGVLIIEPTVLWF